MLILQGLPSCVIITFYGSLSKETIIDLGIITIWRYQLSLALFTDLNALFIRYLTLSFWCIVQNNEEWYYLVVSKTVFRKINESDTFRCYYVYKMIY
jgi:hypothetical protein